jgi:UDP-4-amino-4,6-dideoxy-N-acetyl-beta-L-altrosamine transaminase
MIPYGRQNISVEDIDAVTAVLNSDYLTQGPQVPLFEKNICAVTKAKYAVAANSATSMLHVACLALGVGEGDSVWTSPITFVASANCALYCGASIDFVDVELSTGNMCAQALEKKLQQAKINNSLPKVLIPVHMAGHSCDMKAIGSLAQSYGVKVIEDASHGIGGSYGGSKIGACQYSDITIFSFHPVKIITTAEGGIATTNDKKLLNQMQLFRTHGITKNPKYMTKNSEGNWYYQQVNLGFNYRMNELQAALGISQMNRLDEFVKNKHILKERYDRFLSVLPVIKPYYSSNIYSALHLYPIQIDRNKTNFSRKKLFNELRKKGIGVNIHYIPIHTQPYFLNMGFKHGDFPIAESYYQNSISLPLFSQMSFNEQDKVINTLTNILL